MVFIKILVIKSEGEKRFFQGETFLKSDGIFASKRFIPNMQLIINRDLESTQMKVLELKGTYPILIDNPSEYLPEVLDDHDICIAVGVHEDILIELPSMIKSSGGRAIIVPLESGKWLTKWVKEETIKECKKHGIQYAFPKPFCSLQYGEFDIINQFIDEYKIGKPRFRLTIDENKIITKAEVMVTTPCGNLCDVAKELIGKKIGEEPRRVVAKYWHSFSCLGDVQIDSELGDTIVHVGGHIHYSAVDNAEIVHLKSEDTKKI